MSPSFGRGPRRRSQGFSLVEMLVVVTITAILGMVGIMLFRRYVSSSKGAEAAAIIQAIRAAEESYLAENHVYLNVSTTKAGNAGDPTSFGWYPATPGLARAPWKVASGSDYVRWVALAPAVNRSVQFGYVANAGIAGTPRTALATKASPGWATPTDSWYVIQASGDVNGDGVTAQYAASEATSELYVENEGQ
jgi:prepilin-type N-terminal cleavage/methylation domain-containing protein